MAKSWQQKLHGNKEPQIEVVEKPFWGMVPGDKMLIPTPLLVDAYIKKIPRGETRTVLQMREELAKAHGATLTCPMTSGIFLRIVAEAAHEELAAGKPKDQVTPFWRIIEPKAPIRKKLTFDPAIIEQLLAEER